MMDGWMDDGMGWMGSSLRFSILYYCIVSIWSGYSGDSVWYWDTCTIFVVIVGVACTGFGLSFSLS